jgi:hypothetical protein
MRNARSLRKIEADLEAAFLREKLGPIEIGGLLTEAKDLLASHGKWIAWLEERFPHSVRTAQRYMAAYEFSAKCDTVSHLKLTVGGLYTLASFDNSGRMDVVNAALEEAKTQWVDADRVHEIVVDLRQQEEPPEEEPSPGEEPFGYDEPPPGAELEEDELPPPPLDDDRPPPPPPPRATPKQAGLTREFDTAALSLRRLMARRSDDFASTSLSTVDLLALANFLLQVAHKRAGGDAVDIAVEIVQEVAAK